MDILTPYTLTMAKLRTYDHRSGQLLQNDAELNDLIVRSACTSLEKIKNCPMKRM
jgi:hypothetical protein